VHHEFVPRGETVNKEFYLKVMKRLTEAVHASLLIREFLAKQETIVVPQPPLLSRFGPCGFLLFPKMKSILIGRRFQTIEEIKENSLQDLHAIPQNTFQDVFQNWKKSWERCISSRGEYFEGDKPD